MLGGKLISKWKIFITINILCISIICAKAGIPMQTNLLSFCSAYVTVNSLRQAVMPDTLRDSIDDQEQTVDIKPYFLLLNTVEDEQHRDDHVNRQFVFSMFVVWCFGMILWVT